MTTALNSLHNGSCFDLIQKLQKENVREIEVNQY